MKTKNDSPIYRIKLKDFTSLKSMVCETNEGEPIDIRDVKDPNDTVDPVEKMKAFFRKIESRVNAELEKESAGTAGDKIVHVIYPTKGEGGPVGPETDRRYQKFRLYGDVDSQCANQYVGTLYCSDEEGTQYCLDIGSRFDDEKDSLFSRFILSRTINGGAYIFGEQHSAQVGNRGFLEPVLAMVFVEQINRAYKTGIYRKYCDCVENDSKVKGRIDVSRHIKVNTVFNGNIAYTYRELTALNDVNRLIFTTYKMLERKYPELRHALRYNRNTNDYIAQMTQSMGVTSRSEIHTLLKKTTKKITNPLYREWEKVRQTAILIQRRMGNFIGEQGFGETMGVLIDMNRAWEVYLEKILPSVDRRLRVQEDIAILDHRRTVRPDFYWMGETDVGDRTQPNALVLDAKNKPDWGEVATGERPFTDSVNFGRDKRIREDIFEVFSYMLALNCDACGIMCPVKSEENEIQIQGPYNISQYTEEKSFFVLGLPVRSSEREYGEYKEKMQQREIALAETIHSIINTIKKGGNYGNR